MKLNILTILVINVLLVIYFHKSAAQTNNTQLALSNLPIEEVIIFPNPVFDNNFNVQGKDILSIEVINVIGQSIVKKENDARQGEAINVKLENCDKGLYLVKISLAYKKSIIKKLLVK
jgi:hypothetical protein